MRLFVAVNLPEREKHQLGATLDKLRALALPVRWVEPDSLHVTLKFLGEVAEARVAELRDALERAVRGVKPFNLEIGGFGVFPAQNRARVFWIGLGHTEVLQQLQQRVEQEIAPLGFPTEKREFQPHLTLGRAQGDNRIARPAVEQISEIVRYHGVVEIKSADLMRSHLSPCGARYERMHAANFAAL